MSAVMSAYSSSSRRSASISLRPADGVFEAIHQTGARLLDAGLQAFEQVGFLLNGAE